MDDEPDLASDLLDLSQISLERLDAMPDSVLGAALRRILAETEEDPEYYAGFQSALDPSQPAWRDDGPKPGRGTDH